MNDALSRSIYNRIWVYSSTEADLLKRMGKGQTSTKISLGKVVNVAGKMKQYTSIVTSMDNVKYADSIKVMEGDIRTVHYTPPKTM